MAKIPLEDLDKYDSKSSVEKIKKKPGDFKEKRVRKDKHRQQVDFNWDEDDR